MHFDSLKLFSYRKFFCKLFLFSSSNVGIVLKCSYPVFCLFVVNLEAFQLELGLHHSSNLASNSMVVCWDRSRLVAPWSNQRSVVCRGRSERRRRWSVGERTGDSERKAAHRRMAFLCFEHSIDYEPSSMANCGNFRCETPSSHC